MTGESQVETRQGRTKMASRGSIDELRAFIAEEYRGTVPALVWVGAIPEDEGLSGVRYEYADGSRIEAWGERWTWFANDGAAPERSGSWDPARQPQGADDVNGGEQ
jgi:hypothetical protein